MPRTERQRAMLRAMGIRVFAPEPRQDVDAGVHAPEPHGHAQPQGGRSTSAGPGPPALAPRPAFTDAPSTRGAFAREPLPTASTAPGTPVVAPSSRGVVTSPGALAALDWPALRATVAACRACDLCEARKQTVFGVGHTQAHWMIVGEAPGEQEDLQGEPFVGPAGQLLDAMLRAVGLTRDEAPPEQQVYIANTLKCRPPRNRNPAPEELAKCEPFLLRQIELVRPRVILAMGRFAVQSLLRTEDAIGRLRGKVHQYEGRPLIVTYHPAYLLRNPIDKARSWEDLCLAAEVASQV